MARKRNTDIISVTLDERSYARAIKSLEKYEGRNWRGRVIAAFIAGARLLVAPMRRAAPRNRGGMQRSIQAKLTKKDPRAVVKVNVKPRSPKGAHGHLHSKGHNIVGPTGIPTGDYFEGNSFVERTISAHEGRVIRFIQNQPLDIKGANVRSLIGGLRSF